MNTVPVLIMGSGPAAWSLAAAVTREGLDTVLVAPRPDAEWQQTFGMWTDQWSEEVSDLAGTADPWRERWDRVVVVGGTEQDVGRSYGVLDNERVLRGFREYAARSGRLSELVGTVELLDLEGNGAVARLDDGRSLRARLVFDGTGSGSTFVTRESVPSPSPVLQTAYGIIIRAHTIPLRSDTCVLMDWRGASRRDGSFLYALPFGDGTWLFEETSLARTGGLGEGELRSRLLSRLDDLGVEIVDELSTERVSFPMDVPLPVIGQQVVGIGAAGSLVHPATGYSVAASLRSAAPLARAVVRTADGPVSTAASACWETLWPTDRRRARRLETFGMRRLLAMDQTETRAFFETFFALPKHQTALYLGGEAGARQLRTVMWNVFRHAPLGLRLRLAGGNPVSIVRSLVR